MNWSRIFNAIPSAASSPLALVAYCISVGAFVAIAWSVTRQRNILKKLKNIPESRREQALRIAMGPTLKGGMTASEWIRARIHLYLFLAFMIACFIVIVIFLDATFRMQAGSQPAVGKWNGRLPDDNIVQIYPGVEVVSAKHTVDFSQWTPANGANKENCCQVTWDTDMMVRRVRKDALVFAKRVATSGGEPIFTSRTHPSPTYRKVTINVNRGPVYNKYDVLFDISNEKLDIPFPLHMRTVRNGSFSDPSHEDLYLDIFQPTLETTLIIKFNPTKTGKNFHFAQYANVDGVSAHPFEPAPRDIDRTVPNTLRWTVRHPALGNSYIVEWDW
ncbi:MAG: hypothetical protein LAO78_24315 [Acidobacteriia bacterium]|nr:hypothetical protein [Terriglobia bacterium]